MDFVSCIRHYLYFFHFVGLSPLRQPSSNGQYTKSSSYRIIAQIMIAICLGVSSIMILICGKYTPVALRSLEILVIYFSSIGEVLQAVALLIQYIHHRQLNKEILNAFVKLEIFFMTHMKHRITYDRFSQQYFQRIILVNCGFAQFVLIYAVRWLCYGMYSQIGIQVRILRLITALTTLHIIFYVDMVSYHLHELNLVIDRQIFNRNNSKCSSNADENCFVSTHKLTNSFLMRYQIKCYKNAYSRLWTIAQKLNKCYGWVLIAIMCQHFVDFVYSSFWLFEELRRPTSFVRICREFKGLRLHFSFLVTIMIFLLLLFCRSVLIFHQSCRQYICIEQLMPSPSAYGKHDVMNFDKQ